MAEQSQPPPSGPKTSRPLRSPCTSPPQRDRVRDAECADRSSATRGVDNCRSRLLGRGALTWHLKGPTIQHVEKRTPHYALDSIRATFTTPASLRMTKTAQD